MKHRTMAHYGRLQMPDNLSTHKPSQKTSSSKLLASQPESWAYVHENGHQTPCAVLLLGKIGLGRGILLVQWISAIPYGQQLHLSRMKWFMGWITVQNANTLMRQNVSDCPPKVSDSQARKLSFSNGIKWSHFQEIREMSLKSWFLIFVLQREI